jgi:hypothetical protein
MGDTLDALPERVEIIERKLDALSVSVDRRFDQIDQRFELVDEHFAEQRQYTEFAYERLDQRIMRLERAMLAGFDRLEAAVLARAGRFERLEVKVEELVATWRTPTRPRHDRRISKKKR